MMAVSQRSRRFTGGGLRTCSLCKMIGDGGLTHISPRFTNSNPLLQQDYAQAVAEFPGLKLHTEYSPSGSVSFVASGDMDFIVPERRQFGIRLDAILAGQPRGIG